MPGVQEAVIAVFAIPYNGQQYAISLLPTDLFYLGYTDFYSFFCWSQTCTRQW